jgi:hypothetical protein
MGEYSMTWLAVVAISLAVAIFVAGRKFREKPSRIRERDLGRNYESRYRFAPGRGDDMKKWKDADYSR